MTQASAQVIDAVGLLAAEAAAAIERADLAARVNEQAHRPGLLPRTAEPLAAHIARGSLLL